MTKNSTLFATAVLVAILASPSMSSAQATRRGGDSEGGSSGGTRSAPSGSSEGSAGPRVAVPRSSGSVGTSEPGGAQSGARSGSTPSSERSRISSDGSRARGVRGVSGYAQPRRGSGPNDSLQFLGWYPSYYPYNYGYGSYFNYRGYGYDPWLFGAGWGWSSYGGWYDPFGFPSYGYDPFFGPYPWGPTYGPTRFDDHFDDRGQANLGSIRLRADPKTARVYVDGALAGTVDDFDGFGGHLSIEAGVHQLELRADGYEPYSAEIKVEAGKTRTERANLKRSARAD